MQGSNQSRPLLPHSNGGHRAGAPVQIQRRRDSRYATAVVRLASTSAAVQPITIALPSDINVNGMAHGSNFVGTVILDGPGRRPLAPIPVIAIAHPTPTASHGHHATHSQDAGPTSSIMSASPTDVGEGSFNTAWDTPAPTTAPAASPSSSNVSNSQPAPVFLALSAAGVILLMFVAFMVGFCICRRYSSLASRNRFLPAFLHRRQPKRPVTVLQQHDTASLDKSLIGAVSPVPEKDGDGFETRFIVPALGCQPDRKTVTSPASETPTLPTKDNSGGANGLNGRSGKAISSVARGLAIRRATEIAVSMPPALRYEDIIASPVIASPSAVFSPDISTLSTHSPRDVQRWAAFPGPNRNGTMPVTAGEARTGRLIPDTGSARESPMLAVSPSLRVVNDIPQSSTHSAVRPAVPSRIGLGLVTSASAGKQHAIPLENIVVEQDMFENSETAEIHEDELQDFAKASMRSQETLAAPIDQSIDSETTAVDAPVPSLSVETLQQLTWRDVPEGSLRSGSPLRVGSCDNLAAISPSSSEVSLVYKPAVPESVLRALEGATGRMSASKAGEISAGADLGTISEMEDGDRSAMHARRTGIRGAPGDISSRFSFSKTNHGLEFPLPEVRQLRPELKRRSTQGTYSDMSEELIILSGIAMDGISPIDVPPYPLSLWSSSSASAPALASYAATLATIAASGAAAVATHFPTINAATEFLAPSTEPASQHNYVASSPQKSGAAQDSLSSSSHSPSLSRVSHCSSAHSVLLLREQRLRSNLEAIQRAENEGSGLQSTASGAERLCGAAATSPKPSASSGSPRRTAASSFSLTNLSVLEHPDVSSGRRSLSPSPRKARNRNITPVAAAVSSGHVDASLLDSVPRTLGGGPTLGPSSCGSTPASSRSMETLDTRASSPTPVPFGYTLGPLQINDRKKLNRAHTQYSGGATFIDVAAVRTVGPTPVLTLFPNDEAEATLPTSASEQSSKSLDGAVLAMQEKEQQRILAQNLLGKHAFAPATISAIEEDKSVKGPGTGSPQSNAAVLTSRNPSPFSESLYSHPSTSFDVSSSPLRHGDPSPTPSPLHFNHQLIRADRSSIEPTLIIATSAGAPHGGFILRDSTNSLNLVAAAMRFSGTGSTSADPSERGSYISPTLKLFHFYSTSGRGSGSTLPLNHGAAPGPHTGGSASSLGFNPPPPGASQHAGRVSAASKHSWLSSQGPDDLASSHGGHMLSNGHAHAHAHAHGHCRGPSSGTLAGTAPHATEPGALGLHAVSGWGSGSFFLNEDNAASRAGAAAAAAAAATSAAPHYPPYTAHNFHSHIANSSHRQPHFHSYHYAHQQQSAAGSMPGPVPTAANGLPMGTGMPRPAARADGVVDVFCGA